MSQITSASATEFESFRLQVLSTFLSHPRNVEPAFAFAMYKRLPPVCSDKDERLGGFEPHLNMSYQAGRELIHYFQTQFIDQAKNRKEATLSSLLNPVVGRFPVKYGIDLARYLLIRKTLGLEVEEHLKSRLTREPGQNIMDPTGFFVSEVQIF